MKSVFVTSGDLIADRRFQLGRELEARGDVAGAADLYAQAVEIAPRFASAWFALGAARMTLGDRGGAIAAFRQAKAADPEDRHGASLHLARLGAGEGAMPPAYVRALFDQYAERFEAALVGELSYRGPALLLSAVEAACRVQGRPPRFAAMLDLGCGTGLAAAAFRPFAARIAGVDLSPGMVARARGKGVYDRLAVDDIAPFLAGEGEASADLVVAADVFIYLADLAPVFASVARVLTVDGLFAFTVETHGGAGVILGEKLRYAHPEEYARAALASAGLGVLHLAVASARNEGGVPVPGLVVVANRA